MRLLQLQLSRVLDRDDAFVGRDERREHVERRRLPGAGSAGHHDVEPAPNAGLEELRHRRRHRPEVDQVVGRVRVRGELADGERRTVDGERRDDRVDS